MNYSHITRKTFLSLAAVAMFTGACASNPRTVKGGAAGAVLGGIVGGATGGGKGAAIGAGVGAVSGAAIGAYLDRRKAELSKVVETQKTENGLMVVLKNDILFDFDRAELQPGGSKTLDELAKILVKYPDDRLEIAGFTDDVGAASYNQALSERRAEAVRSYLTSRGVKPAQVEAIGRGEMPNIAKTDAARSQARRVQIFIDPKIPEEGSQALSE